VDIKRRRIVKRIWFVLAAAVGGLLVIGCVLSAIFFLASTKEYVQIRTDTEPIYNHFPEVPETTEIQWCSRTSVSIGPSTLRLHIFAFYDHDISSELQDMDMKIENQSEEIELYYVPEEINGNQNWRRINNVNFAFQVGIKDNEKMYTTVYINDTGTILYIDAIGS